LRPPRGVPRPPLHGDPHVRALPGLRRLAERRRGGPRRAVRHRPEHASRPALRPGGPAPTERPPPPVASGPPARRLPGRPRRTPGSAEKTTGHIDSAVEPVLAADSIPLVLGGDHSIVLGELRAHAAKHGPVGVVLLDAHADTWEAYYGERYFHGTPFKRALEEGLIDPHRSLLAGMRGPLYAAADLDEPREWGFQIVPCEELRTWTPAEYGARVRERIGDGPTYLSFDIDAIDPAFAPGTGTPEVAGLLPHEAIAFLRSLAGIRFTGFDVVEVSPPYDGPGQVTALTGASIAYELMALAAVAAAGR